MLPYMAAPWILWDMFKIPWYTYIVQRGSLGVQASNPGGNAWEMAGETAFPKRWLRLLPWAFTLW